MSGITPRVVIAGTHSGAGKTTVSIGLMAALSKRGLRLQPFKAGPDYIDPTFHHAVSGRISRNLDPWMTSEAWVKHVFLHAARDADISVIEGVMGFYDGHDGQRHVASTAHIAKLLKAPVLLVVDVHAMAASAAAIVYGFQRLDEDVNVAGVILNRVAGARHFQMVKEAIEADCGIPVVGGLKKNDALHMPSRHLGLIPSIERGEQQPLFERLSEQIEADINLDKVLAIAKTAPELKTEPLTWPQAPAAIEMVGARQGATLSAVGGAGADEPPVKARIGVAKDLAFHFYYQDNFDWLEQAGADLVFFSPLNDRRLPPDLDALYIGGGFPETFVAELSANQAMIAAIRQFYKEGGSIYAECGGQMYLTRSIQLTTGETYPMVGLIPAVTKMQAKRFALGYTEVESIADTMVLAQGDTARGHEFHYSLMEPIQTPFPYAYRLKGKKEGRMDGFAAERLLASYIHLHFASNPQAAYRLVEQVRPRG
jgi:cobyrinic acid a,c-diamide synthase